jgi:hypothetical protein
MHMPGGLGKDTGFLLGEKANIGAPSPKRS